MLRSFLNLMHSPLGFDPAGVVTAGLPLDIEEISATSSRDGRGLAGRNRSSPRASGSAGGERRRSAATGAQVRRGGGSGALTSRMTPPILATQQFALPGYLGVIGTPLLKGRDFTDDDIAAAT